MKEHPINELLRGISLLFAEVHGRSWNDDNEVIQWARKEGLIRDDEFGMFCLLGLAEGVPVDSNGNVVTMP